MSSADLGHRPVKKRRFFVEDPEDLPQQNTPAISDASVGTSPDAQPTDLSSNEQWNRSSQTDINESEAQDKEETGGFDTKLFSTIVGEEVPHHVVQRIREAAGDNMERAINLYFDGSWKSMPDPLRTTGRLGIDGFVTRGDLPQSDRQNTLVEAEGHESPKSFESMPEARYIGAFGVEAWTTKSGVGLIKHGDTVKIERTKLAPKMKMGKGGKMVPVQSRNQRSDVITRFTNQRGEEIGRLTQDTADWVSTLIDQKICKLEGVCVFAPDRIKVNDTVFMQLRCYLLRRAFEAGGFAKADDDNRATGLFEEKESQEEKDLRLRQVALVKLFDEVNLHPTTINEMTARHKKEGLLRAAEVAEGYDRDTESAQVKQKSNGGSSPPSEAEEGQELEEDQLDSLYKKAQSFDFNTPEAQPAETFAMDLRKYQKQALHWMLNKERDEKSNRQASMHPLWEEYTWPTKDVDDKLLPQVEGQDRFYVNPYSGEVSLDFPVQEQNCLGGVLADEMGLGKTIEMLSLMHSHRSDIAMEAQNTQTTSVNNLPRLPGTSSAVEWAPCTTLVVAPMSLLSQWESEAMKASKPGTMKTLVYYGNDKSVNLQQLCSPANAASAPGLIITSYGIVLSEFNQIAESGGDRGKHGGLFSIEYFRVILDEAHTIKNRLAKTSKACYELAAIHRWVLTGTPIVNRLEDLFSLVRFLKVEPWNNFSFWKTFITMPFESGEFIRALNVVQTVLEPLVLRRTKDMKTPEGEALVPLPPRTIKIEEIELSKAEREVYDFIFHRAKRTFNANVEAGTLMKSYTTIFAQILRLRQSCCHPVLTRNKDIVADEEDVAAAAEAAGMADDMDLSDLIERFTTATTEAEKDETADPTANFTAHVLRQIQSDSTSECPICAEEPIIEPAVTGCWHSACKKCLEEYVAHQRDKGDVPRCFSCREPVYTRDLYEIVRHGSNSRSPSSTSENDDLYGATQRTPTPTPRISLRRLYPLSPSGSTSAKIAALLSHLTSLPPNTKSIVFSQFTGFMDLISPQLTRARIPHLRLDGTLSQKSRARVLREFSAETTASADTRASPPSVLLISLKAGGVGLNLTAASRVFMMDPWWSFAVEAQAIDRVHRMGQVREVEVIRFVVKESIELRMLKVQERKKWVAGSLGMHGGEGAEERKKRRIEDLEMLLG